MQEIAADLARLKKYAQLLEEENARLKEELVRVARDPGFGGAEAAGVPEAGGMSNLISLYDRGFHICNLYFGEMRTGDCLFCAAFIERNRR